MITLAELRVLSAIFFAKPLCLYCMLEVVIIIVKHLDFTLFFTQVHTKTLPVHRVPNILVIKLYYRFYGAFLLSLSSGVHTLKQQPVNMLNITKTVQN